MQTLRRGPKVPPLVGLKEINNAHDHLRDKRSILGEFTLLQPPLAQTSRDVHAGLAQSSMTTDDFLNAPIYARTGMRR